MSGKRRAVDKTSADIDRSTLGSVVYRRYFPMSIVGRKRLGCIDSKISRSGHRLQPLERTEIRPGSLIGYSSRYQKVHWPMHAMAESGVRELNKVY